MVEVRRFLASEGETSLLNNVVFMGMGEPLHNFESVAVAVDIMCCTLGLHMSPNKVCRGVRTLYPEP